MSRLVFLGLGAALMFFGDPQSGRKRRAEVTNRIDTARRTIEHGGDVVRDVKREAHGLIVETRGAIERRGGPQGPTLYQIARDSVDSWQRPEWTPAQRALAGATGAGIAMFGYLRGGVKGMAWCAIGGGLLARATRGAPAGSLVTASGQSATDPLRH